MAPKDPYAWPTPDWALPSSPSAPSGGGMEEAANEEPSWTQWAIANALRIGPAIGGGLLGGGFTPMGVALGAAGAGLGETLGEWYEGTQNLRGEFNPWQIGTQTALGGLTAGSLFGKAPEIGATVKELGKYAVRAPFAGAAEGALLGGAATVPTQLAETGQLPSWEQAGEGALGGTLFGAGFGALGSRSAMKQARGLEGIADSLGITATPPPPTGAAPSAPAAAHMPAGIADTSTLPPVEAFAPGGAAPATRPDVPGVEFEGNIAKIIMPSAANSQRLRELGYEPWVNHPSPEGYNQYIRNAPEGGADTAFARSMQAKTQEVGPPAPGDIIPINADGTVTIPRDRITPPLLERLKSQGIHLVARDEQGNGRFLRVGRTGVTANPDEPALEVVEGKFGGPPRQPITEGELTGKVADFGFIPEETQPGGAPIDPARLQEFATDLRGQVDAETLRRRQDMDLDEIHRANDRSTLTRLLEHWYGQRETARETNNAALQRHAAVMSEAASSRLRALMGSPQLNMNMPESGANRGINLRADRMEIRGTDDLQKLNEILHDWRARLSDARNSGNLPTMDHATTMVAYTEQKLAQMVRTTAPEIPESWQHGTIPGADPNTGAAVPPLTYRQTRRPGQNFEVFNTNTNRTYTWHATAEEAQAKVDKLYRNNSPEFDFREHPPQEASGPSNVIQTRGGFADTTLREPPPQEGLPFGPAGLREQTQLENISNAPREEPIDLGPQPTQQELQQPIQIPDEGFEGPSFEVADEGFAREWQTAIKKAETLGINWRQFDSLEKLNKAIIGTARMMKNLRDSETVDRTMARMPDFDPNKQYLMPWEHRPNDPPEIMMKREELASLMGSPGEEINNLVDAASKGEAPNWTEEEARRVIQLNDELDEFDAMGDMPAMAKVKGGGLVVDANITRAAENITKDYSGPLSGIMVREGLQNALDASDKLGAGGVTNIRLFDKNTALGRPNATIEIYDNGAGLDEAGLAQKLVRLFATGKEGEQGATGGKGIGSASYILGGKHVTIETVAVDSVDGKKYRVIAGGTKDQFLDPVKGSDWSKKRVPDSTPTGTIIKVILKDDQSHTDAHNMAQKIVQFSRDRPSVITFDEYGIRNPTEPISEIQPSGSSATRLTVPSSADDKVIGDLTYRNNEIKVQIPKFDETIKRRAFNTHHLNNGMYQFTERVNIPGGQEIEGIPPDVIVNIHPLVDDLHDDYPFINTREHLKAEFKTFIDEFVDKNIKGPAVQKRKNRVQELYDAMSTLPLTGTIRKPALFDAGDRMTPQERTTVENHPLVHNLIQFYDGFVDHIIKATGRTAWGDKLEGVGLVFDPNMHGVHIPNPTTKKSTILFNPFIRIDATTPNDAAFRGAITGLHEVAHIGTETGGIIPLSVPDHSDPRLGKFFESYIEQLAHHGDVNWMGTGHDVGWIHRLGEVYAAFGPGRTFDVADRYENLLTGGRPQSGRYSREVQDLLQIYKDSRGRDATTEDLLSGTGVKSATTGATEGNIPGAGQANGAGTTPPVPPTAVTGGGGTSGLPPPPPGNPKKPTSKLREWYNLARGATTILDLSAPLRQGLPLILRKEWWRSWKQQLGALGSDGATTKAYMDIMDRPIFQDNIDTRTGKAIDSWATRAGLRIHDPYETHASGREEATPSNWIETGGMVAKIPGAQPLYQQTLGRAAKASNRAYITYLNQLRADTFESLMKDAKRAFDADVVAGGRQGKRNPYEDLPFAKEIADFVNTATGRGPLRGSFFGEAEHSLEQSAKRLTDLLFSPRLIASRIRMLSPGTYMMADPFVRKQYLKGLFGVAAAWGTVAGVAKMAGADVSMDPNSADFGKVRFPGSNTRLDAAGGFQQYLVAASRLISGSYTSSATQQSHEFGAGFQAETRKDTAERFAANKLHPVLKFGYDLLDASQYQPFHVADRTAQLFIPLIVQDILDLAKSDPSLLPIVIPPVAAGMGTQTYGKGESVSRVVPPQYDWSFTGGNVAEEIPEDVQDYFQ